MKKVYKKKVLTDLFEEIRKGKSLYASCLKVGISTSEFYEILSNNENSVNDYKSGNERAIKFLMGQIMKETKGSANPELVNKLLLEELNK